MAGPGQDPQGAAGQRGRRGADRGIVGSVISEHDILCFLHHVRREESCWIWRSTLDRDGYGKFGRHGRHLTAHRFAYLWARGPIPSGLVIDHLCRVRSCVNPDHLEAVTQAENVARGLHMPGEANPSARLTAAQVADIRARHEAGQSGRSIARLYGVGFTTVRHIFSGHHWARTVAV